MKLVATVLFFAILQQLVSSNPRPCDFQSQAFCSAIQSTAQCSCYDPQTAAAKPSCSPNIGSGSCSEDTSYMCGQFCRYGGLACNKLCTEGKPTPNPQQPDSTNSRVLNS